MTALQCINPLKPDSLAGFEPLIFCSWDGSDASEPRPQDISAETVVNSTPFFVDIQIAGNKNVVID
jgi:hypothetical protein